MGGNKEMNDEWYCVCGDAQIPWSMKAEDAKSWRREKASMKCGKSIV